jgi:hypothetical protein
MRAFLRDVGDVHPALQGEGRDARSVTSLRETQRSATAGHLRSKKLAVHNARVLKSSLGGWRAGSKNR